MLEQIGGVMSHVVAGLVVFAKMFNRDLQYSFQVVNNTRYLVVTLQRMLEFIAKTKTLSYHLTHNVLDCVVL